MHKLDKLDKLDKFYKLNFSNSLIVQYFKINSTIILKQKETFEEVLIKKDIVL